MQRNGRVTIGLVLQKKIVYKVQETWNIIKKKKLVKLRNMMKFLH